MFLLSLTRLKVLSLSCVWLVVTLALPSHAAPNLAGPPVANCPFSDVASLRSAVPSPGTETLGRALTLLEQQRYAAAYAGLKAALHQGLSDPLERAHAYKSVGLIMCRFQSDSACEKNLLYALGSSAELQMTANELAVPRVKRAYEKALVKFESLCGAKGGASPHNRPVTAALPASTEMAIATSKPSQPISTGADTLLTQVSPPDRSLANTKAATVLLQITPWAAVVVDGGREIITPPIKSIQMEPGEREIVILNSAGQTVIIEASFKAGQTWVLHHGF